MPDLLPLLACQRGKDVAAAHGEAEAAEAMRREGLDDPDPAPGAGRSVTAALIQRGP